jgi:ribosome recycling factor
MMWVATNNNVYFANLEQSERIQNDGYRRLRKEDDDMKKDYVEEIDSLLIFVS